MSDNAVRLRVYKNLAKMRSWFDSRKFTQILSKDLDASPNFNIHIIDDPNRLPYLVVYDDRELMLIVQPRQTLFGLRYSLMKSISTLGLQINSDGSVPFNSFQITCRCCTILNLMTKSGYVAIHSDPIDPQLQIVYIVELPGFAIEVTRFQEVLKQVDQEGSRLNDVLEAQLQTLSNQVYAQNEWFENSDPSDE